MMCPRYNRKTLLFAGLFLFLIAASLNAQAIHYSLNDQKLIEERLQQALDKNSEREETLKKLFEEVGCKGDRLTEQPVKGSRVPNVICTLSGTGENMVIVGAHFDKVEQGKGAVDNWSGASLLPSLFQSLSLQPRRFTFVFVGFSDEEKGLVGSKFYVKQLRTEDKAKIRAMVNIDSLGLSSTKVWVSRADKNLVAALSRVAYAMKLPVQGVNVEKVGDGDSHPFVREKIPAIDFHSITQETLSILHSPQDALSAVNLDEFYNTYRLLAAYLAFLDLTLEANTTSNSSP